MAKLDGWIHNEGQVPLAKPKGLRVVDMDRYVGVQLSWSPKGWEFPEGDDKTLQVGFTAEQALKLADALRQAGERAQAAADKAKADEA